MLYHHVCLESFGYTLPDEVVTSDEIEHRLQPLYQRLRLPEGRLELMTGIKERRFWKRGTLPSGPSVASGEKALQAASISRDDIGCLIHASVCRDYLEPATACGVHQRLGLPAACMIYDISNACLGFLNGMLQIANLIELGQIKAGLVVASEGSRELVETTIEHLNADLSLTRDTVKLAVASLTIGSGSVAAVLCHSDLSQTNNRLLGGVVQCDTSGSQLCHSGRDEAAAGQMRPLMQTDSEALMHAGVALGARAFEAFLAELGWTRDDVAKTFCHQIGSGHRKLMFDKLGLSTRLDFTTLEFLGNTGSVALPITMAMGCEQGSLSANDCVSLLGIGSGINTIMLGLEWQRSQVAGGTESELLAASH